MIKIGGQAYYYPTSWVTGEPKKDNLYYGQKCQVVEMRGKLVWVLFADKSVSYVKRTELQSKEKKEGDNNG